MAQWHGDADDFCLAGAQTAGHRVEPIAVLRRYGRDTLASGLGDLGVTRQSSRNGRFRDTGQARDLPHSDLSRGDAAHALTPLMGWVGLAALLRSAPAGGILAAPRARWS